MAVLMCIAMQNLCLPRFYVLNVITLSTITHYFKRSVNMYNRSSVASTYRTVEKYASKPLKCSRTLKFNLYKSFFNFQQGNFLHILHQRVDYGFYPKDHLFLFFLCNYYNYYKCYQQFNVLYVSYQFSSFLTLSGFIAWFSLF